MDIKLKGEYIKLGQAMKASGLVQDGANAKFLIQDGFVLVNGQVTYERGKKLRVGDVVEVKDNHQVVNIIE